MQLRQDDREGKLIQSHGVRATVYSSALWEDDAALLAIMRKDCMDSLHEERGEHRAMSHTGPQPKLVKSLEKKAIALLSHEKELLEEVTQSNTDVTRHYDVEEHDRVCWSRSRRRSKSRVANPTLGCGCQADPPPTGCQPDSSVEPDWIKYNCHHCGKQIENECCIQPIFAKVEWRGDDFPFHRGCWEEKQDELVEDKKFSDTEVGMLVYDIGPQRLLPR